MKRASRLVDYCTQTISMSFFRRLVLLVLAVVSNAQGQDNGIRARQSGPRADGSIFPSAIVYDPKHSQLKVLNNQEQVGQDGDDVSIVTKCTYHVYDAMTLHPKGQYSFGGMSKELCHNLLNDKYNSSIYVVGRSKKGGLLRDYERSSPFDFSLTSSEYYGMLLDMKSTNIPGDEHGKISAQLQGGAILKGSNVVYTVGLASDNRTVYTVSLHSSDTTVSKAATSNSTPSINVKNPSNVFPMGSAFEMVVEAFDKVEYIPEPTSYDNNTLIGKAFPTRAWDHKYTAQGKNATISNVAGVLVGRDALIVAGSDVGIGSGIGTADSATKADSDGFVTKLVLQTGELYGDSAAMAGSPTAYRLQTDGDHQDYIYGMCPGETDEFVYLTGSTTGRIKTGGFNVADGSTRAFLIKLNITSMQEEWGMDMGAAPPKNVSSAPAEGRACAVSHTGDMVYFAGNVFDGGTIRESNDMKSLGGSDIFVAKVDTQTGDVEFVRQIGSSSDELLAPHGGLVVTNANDIVVFGQTSGSLYRIRYANESEQVFDYFMTMLDVNGTVEEQVADPIATMTPTASPTEVPTQAPTLPPNACKGSNCTVHTYSFSSVKLYLKGVGYIDSEAAAAFEDAVGSFYNDFYASDGSAGASRRLQQNGVHNFQTNVSYWGGSAQDGGNLLTYNQSVTFESNRPDVDAEFAETLIVEPLLYEENRKSITQYIEKSHETFANVETVSDPPTVPDKNRPTNAAGSVDMSVFIWIGAAIFCLCICWGVFTAWNMEQKDKTEDFDEKDDIDQPEAPLESVEIA